MDILLLHCLTQPDWPERYSDAMQALTRAKEQGKVRAVGVSCHDFGAFCAAAGTDWVEVVLARINFDGVHMDADPADVVPLLERMYADGKAIYGMKVLGCRNLVKHARKAIQYVFGLGCVHAVTIGTSRKGHLRQNLKLVEEITPKFPLRSRGPLATDSERRIEAR